MADHREPERIPYRSDRWVTPGVVIVGIIVLGGVLALTITATAYLSLRRIDPDPMIRLVMDVAGNASAFLVLLLTLVKRKTETKVERNTGTLGAELADVRAELAAITDALYAPTPEPAEPPTMAAPRYAPPPVPVPPGRGC